MSECPRHRQPRKMYQGELAYSIRLAKQRNVEKLDLLFFQFAKAGKSSRLILGKEPGNVLLRVSYEWAIGYEAGHCQALCRVTVGKISPPKRIKKAAGLTFRRFSASPAL